MKRHSSTLYTGRRLIGDRGEILGVSVYAGDALLDPRPSWAIRNHSPTGFEWGYSGSGPAQLALAIVLDATGDRDLAERSYQWFKSAVVAGWGGDIFAITAGEVFDWLRRFEVEAGAEPAAIVEGKGGDS